MFFGNIYMINASFCSQTGDFATVTAKSSCQCDSNLYWVLMRDDQFVAWGQQKPQILGEGQKGRRQKGCEYKLG